MEMGKTDRAYTDYCQVLDEDKQNKEALLTVSYTHLEEGALIRKAVDASLDENVRTPEIQVADGAKYRTKEVGQWIVDYIKKA